MKKELLEKELETLLAEVSEHQNKVELEFATAKFLRDEADKLISEMKNPSITDIERKELLRKMESLQRRIVVEQNIVERGIAKLNILSRKTESIKELIESGKVE